MPLRELRTKLSAGMIRPAAMPYHQPRCHSRQQAGALPITAALLDEQPAVKLYFCCPFLYNIISGFPGKKRSGSSSNE
ncbi:hypothetical protein R70723_30660 [Paenibacillus sp. FSL R7-0273]|nr:hypothetical protein R70723_30660 [Paenibacillus sp. FSL R7-0273]OMF92346.1 hypothetical protein BK144_13455 [Paenibacillus sp. FSL R7-0273]